MRLIRKILVSFVYTSYGMQICKFFTRKQPRILMYHRFSGSESNKSVSVNLFEKQLKLIKQDFNVLSLNDLIILHVNNKKIPDNSIVLTIDDGYYDFYKYAYPLLKKYSTPATFFITTSFTSQKIWLWPDIIQYVIDNTQVENLIINLNSNKVIDLSKKNSWERIVQYLISLKNHKRLEFINKLCADAKVNLPAVPTSHYSAASWENIYEMSNNGIEIGCHTLTHPILSSIESNNLLKNEVIDSKKIIEEKLQTEIYSFCFPNGSNKDFNDNVKSIVKKAGYSCSVSATLNDDLFNDLYEIGRISAGSSMKQFIKSAYGYEVISFKIKNKINSLIRQYKGLNPRLPVE